MVSATAPITTSCCMLLHCHVHSAVQLTASNSPRVCMLSYFAMRNDFSSNPCYFIADQPILTSVSVKKQAYLSQRRFSKSAVLRDGRKGPRLSRIAQSSAEAAATHQEALSSSSSQTSQHQHSTCNVPQERPRPLRSSPSQVAAAATLPEAVGHGSYSKH